MRLPETVPHLNPAAVGLALAPEYEPDRVAPVWLTLVAELLVLTVAVAVWPPEVPPPVSLHNVVKTSLDT